MKKVSGSSTNMEVWPERNGSYFSHFTFHFSLFTIFAAFALCAFIPLSAQAADKLIVKDTEGSTKFVVTDTGKVGLGVAAPEDILDVYSENDSTRPGISVHRYVDSFVAPSFRGFKARGTGASAPLPVQAGDVAFSFLGFGYESSTPSFKQIGGYRIVVESISGANIAAYLRFDTTNSAGSNREVMRLDGNGNMGIGTTTPTQKLDVNGNGIRIEQPRTPASSSDSCNQGEMSWDSSYVYVCTATNEWKRAALASW